MENSSEYKDISNMGKIIDSEKKSGRIYKYTMNENVISGKYHAMNQQLTEYLNSIEIENDQPLKPEEAEETIAKLQDFITNILTPKLRDIKHDLSINQGQPCEDPLIKYKENVEKSIMEINELMSDIKSGQKNSESIIKKLRNVEFVITGIGY